MATPRLLALALLLVPAVPVRAHELTLSSQLAPPAVIVRAAYADSEPVPFAKVQVFSPARPSAEFQNAKADARGFFSFVPDSSGSWRVVIDDEMGHRAELTVSVPDPFSSAAASSSSTPRWERAVTGLALLAAATGFLYGYRARRKPA